MGGWSARENAALERKDGDEGMGRITRNGRGKEGGISVRVRSVHGTVRRVHVRGGVSRTTDEESIFIA